MNYLYRYLAVGCVYVMTILSGVAMAAPSPDGTEKTDAAAEPTQSLGTSLADIDLASFLIRNLYREPDKDVSDLDKWLRGWALSAYWNPNLAGRSMMNNEDLNLSGFGAAISKDVSPASTFRLDYSYRGNQGLYTQSNRHRIGLNYLFNISNFYYGYDLSRQNEWLLSMGTQFGVTTNQEGSYKREEFPFIKPFNKPLGWMGVNMGLQYRKNISPELAFFIEQQFELNTDNWDGQDNDYDIDPSINVLVGLLYRLGDPKRNIVINDREDSFRWYTNTFYQIYFGYSGLSNSHINNGSLTFDDAGKYTGNTPGANFGFNFGKWLNPSLGFRLGYFENVVGQNTKVDPAYTVMDYNYFLTLRGGRAEMLFNPLAVFADRNTIGRIGWELFAGVEVGQLHLHKYGYNNYFNAEQGWKALTYDNNGKPTVGLTMGTQLKYFVNKRAALFVEGRMSDLEYNTSKEAGFNSDGVTQGKLYSASFGLEYYMGGWDRYERFKHWDTYETKLIERLENNKRLYLEMAGGLGHQIHWGEHLPNTFDIESTFGIGMRYNDYFGGRARFNYSYRNSNLFISNAYAGNPNVGSPSSIFRLSADATFNLTNLWFGIDNTGERPSDLYLFAGPVFGGYKDDLDAGVFNKFAWGGNVGLQLTRRITPEWEIFLEPRYEFYQRGLTNRWNVLTGVIYNYNAEKNDEYLGEPTKWADRWFMETAAGAGLAFDQNLLGASGRLSVGRRFNPYSSIRLNSMLSFIDPMNKGDYTLETGSAKHKYKIEAGADYMYNISNFWYGVNPYRRTNLRAFFGLNGILAGKASGGGGIFTPSADLGLQWSYDLTGNLSLFVEPRYEQFFSNEFSSRADLFVGATWYNNYHTWRANRLFFNDDAHYPFALVEPGYVRPGQKSIDAEVRRNNWFTEFALGGTLPTSPYNSGIGMANIVSPTVSLGLGYNFDDYSAVRATANYYRSSRELYEGDPTFYNFNLGLDYRFNLTNWVMGINPYRPMDAYLFAGPTLRMYNLSEVGFRNKAALGLNGGAHLAYHLTNNLDLFGEARYNHFTALNKLNDKIFYHPSERMHNDLALLVGATWYNKEFDHSRLTPWDDELHKANYFYQLGGGLSRTLQYEYGLAPHFAPSGFAAMGYGIDDYSSARAVMTTHMKEGDKVLQVGADYMFNFTNWLLGVNPYRRFDLQLLAGPIARIENITNPTESLGFDFGANAGGQLLYHLNSHIDLFGEGRFDFWRGQNAHRGDLYAGLSYYTNRHDPLTSNWLTDEKIHKNNLWVEAAIGGTLPVHSTRQLGVSDKLSVGYNFGNYSALRLTALNHWHLNSGYNTLEQHRYVIAGGLDYMFNITQFMFDDPTRRTDFYAYAGGYGRLQNLGSSTESMNLAIGAIGGLQANYHLTQAIDLFLAGQAEKWTGGNQYRLSAYGGTRLYNTHDPLTSKWRTDEKIHNNNVWVEAAIGGTMPVHSFKQLGVSDKLSLGYNFGNYSALRLSSLNHWHLNSGYNTLEQHRYVIAGGLDYMFNLSKFVFDDPSLRTDLYAYAGGYGRVENLGSSTESINLAIGAIGGLQANYHLTQSVDLFLAGQAEKWTGGNQYRLTGFGGTRLYNTHDPVTSKWRTEEATHTNNWFMEAAVGATVPIHSFKQIGASDKLSLGYAFGKYSALRASMMNHWHLNTGYNTLEQHRYVISGGMDYMFNVSKFLFDDPSLRTDLYAYAGGYGRVENLGNKYAGLKLKIGAIGGLQADYHLNQQFDLFLAGQGEVWRQGNQLRLTGYAGTRYYTNPSTTRLKSTKPLGVEDKKTLFVDLGYGVGSSMAPSHVMSRFKYIDQTLHAGAGMHFNPYLSARGRLNFTLISDKHRNDTEESRTNIIELGVDGMWNVTNTLFGTNPYRRLDLYAFAGPTMCFDRQNDADRYTEVAEGEKKKSSKLVNFGVNGGGRIAYHLNGNIDLVGEGRLDFNNNEGFFTRYEAMLGTSFRLDNSPRLRKGQTPQERLKQMQSDRLYLQFLAGLQVASIEGRQGGMKKSQSQLSMPTFDYRIGRRLGDVFALQAGIFSQKVGYMDWHINEPGDFEQYGIRGELVVNAINLFNSSYDAHDTRFNWLLMGGAQLSRLKSVTNKRSDFGITVATQAQYRVTGNTWALLEARAQQISNYGTHVPMTVSLGLQHDLHGNATSKKVGEALNSNRNHLQVSAGTGFLNARSTGLEAALFYRFAKNSAVRLEGDAAYTKYGYWISTDLSYMGNVTNLLLGIDDYRRVNLWMFGGLGIMGRGVQTAIKNGDFGGIFTGLTNNGVSFNYGAHADIKLTNDLSVYTEARFVSLTNSTDLCKNHHDKVNLFTTFGVKYDLPW